MKRKAVALLFALPISLLTFLSGCSSQDPCSSGHDFDPATCTTLRTCTVCGLTDDAYGYAHKVEEWVVSKESTCTEKGSEQGLCTICSETVERTLWPKHTEGEWYIKEAESGGVYNILPCAICGEIIDNEIIEEPTFDIEVSESDKYQVGEDITVSGRVTDISSTCFWLEGTDGLQYKCTPPYSGVLDVVSVGETMEVHGTVLSKSKASVNLEKVYF